MPNRYSHALVLSTYESKGLIDLPPNPSLHHLSPHPFLPSSTSDDAAAAAAATTTPPLNALPGLAASENSSTASTTSSLDLHPPSRKAGLPPQHSATSSLVTEIYAPPTGSPLLPLEGRPTVIAAEEEDGHLIELPPFPPGKKQLSQAGGPLSQIASIELPPPPSPPSSKQPPPPERPPSKATSRFSSLHNFSAFLDPLPRAKRHRKPSYKDTSIRRESEPEYIVPVSSVANTPYNPPYRQPFYPKSQEQKQQVYTPHSRLNPTPSTSSLHFLTHTDVKTDIRPPPHQPTNMDVSPWEYPTTLSSSPFPPAASPPPPPPSAHSTPPPPLPSTRRRRRTITTTNPTISIPIPLTRHHQRSPSSLSPTSFLPTQDTTDPIFSPIFFPPPPPSLDLHHGETLLLLPERPSRSRAESFDSVAPPPIRKGPLSIGRGRRVSWRVGMVGR
ncbi:MAG: hypothetical protein Q9185_003396 [Variospora sp. 1 TL-2023]